MYSIFQETMKHEGKKKKEIIDTIHTFFDTISIDFSVPQCWKACIQSWDKSFSWCFSAEKIVLISNEQENQCYNNEKVLDFGQQISRRTAHSLG